MAYLWTLEQQPDQASEVVAHADRSVENCCSGFFLLDQLAITPEELRRPLLDLTERFGVRRVTWLRHKQSSQAMGILSPTVIVRPLPDFGDEDLERWRSDLKDNDRDFRHLLHVAVKDLERMSAIIPFCHAHRRSYQARVRAGRGSAKGARWTGRRSTRCSGG